MRCIDFANLCQKLGTLLGVPSFFFFVMRFYGVDSIQKKEYNLGEQLLRASIVIKKDG